MLHALGGRPAPRAAAAAAVRRAGARAAGPERRRGDGGAEGRGAHGRGFDGGVDSQIWHHSRPTGLYSLSRIWVFVKSFHVILLVKGYVFPGL